MNLLLICLTAMSCVMAITIRDEVHLKRPTYFEGSILEKSLYQGWENLYGFIAVRPEAYIFYWLFYADGTKVNATNKPLVIWIQGGPAFAASGVGNFAEIGPINMNMQPRNHTWVKGRNVLFIDHPVGAGFSYVTNSSQYAKTDRDIAVDLSKLIKVFYKRHKEFRNTPTYLFSQSYGGKVCPRLAYYLHTAIEKQSLKMNFKGIGIGGGWVNPKESTSVQPRTLYYMGAIDRKVYIRCSKIARKLVRSLEIKDMHTVNALDTTLFESLNAERVINFNNVYAESPYPALEKLKTFMNQFIKPTLIGVNQTRQWEYLNIIPYNHLMENFLLPSMSFLEAILNNTNLKIAIYNGNLDAVAPLPGAVNWVHKLKWHGAKEFAKAKRKPIPGGKNGFYKTMKNLSFWWVLDAGHWVPEENPEAMEQILRYVIEDDG